MLRPALLCSVLFLSACGGDEQSAGTNASGDAPAPTAPALTDAERQTRLVSLPAPYNAGDLENGRRQFGKCRSCHTIAEGGPNMTGPNLYGVFGRQAGSHPDFAYSEAVAGAGWTWDAQRLDGWLADPRGYLPGTKMSFAGIKDAEDRRDLIAYLKVETGYGAETAPR